MKEIYIQKDILFTSKPAEAYRQESEFHGEDLRKEINKQKIRFTIKI